MEMEEKTGQIRRRIIVVKKRPTAALVVEANRGGGGIGMFDEYIRKSGLEPKTYQREGVEFCLRREAVVSASAGGAWCAAVSSPMKWALAKQSS